MVEDTQIQAGSIYKHAVSQYPPLGQTTVLYYILLFPSPTADSWHQSLYTRLSIQGRLCQNPNEPSQSQTQHIHPGFTSTWPPFPHQAILPPGINPSLVA